ncbi:MAG: GspH/FimT family pseudopilin [Desulfosalsimonadaceae bacterium]
MANKKGFTLLELLVVLVLISLVTALVAPRLAAPLGNLQLKTAVKKIAGSLRYARSLAASEKINRLCVFDFDNQTVAIYSESEPGDDSGTKAAGQGSTYVLPEGVQLKQAYAGDTAVDNGVFQVNFFANGSSSGGDIVIEGENGRAMLIHIDFITGMVEIAKSSSE